MENYNLQSTPLAEAVAIATANAKRNGQFHTIVMRKDFTDLPKYCAGMNIVKIVTMQGRFGVDFDNTAEQIAKREQGIEKGQLKGFEMIDEDFLYRSCKSGKQYIRFTTYKGSQHQADWYLNGEPVTLEQLLAMGVPAYKLVHKSDLDAIPLMVDATKVLAIR